MLPAHNPSNLIPLPVEPDSNDKLKAARLLEKARNALSLGDPEVADALLTAASQLDPSNEKVWLCWAAMAKTLEQARPHVEKALSINPDNRQAAAWIEKVERGEREARAASKAESGQEPAAETAITECPFCKADISGAAQRCPGCQAVLSLDSLEALAKNDDADADRLAESLAALEQQLGKGPDVETHTHIALGYLNLRRSGDALEHLEQACRLSPNDKTLQLASLSVRKRRMVLIVDTDESVRKSLSQALEYCEVRVQAARDTTEAHSALSEETPDLVIAASGEREVREMEICRRLRKDPRSRLVPFWVLMDQGNVPIRNRVMGVSGSIKKPIEVKDLLARVKELFPDTNIPDPDMTHRALLDFDSASV